MERTAGVRGNRSGWRALAEVLPPARGWRPPRFVSPRPAWRCDSVTKPARESAPYGGYDAGGRRIADRGGGPPARRSRTRARVILFGSHARGEAHPQSEVDFLVVEPDVEDEAGESVRLRRELRGLRLPADIVVDSRYAEDWADVRGSFVHAALSQGRVLAG